MYIYQIYVAPFQDNFRGAPNPDSAKEEGLDQFIIFEVLIMYS